MIDCERALERETLYAYLDGAVDHNWMMELREHYDICPECSGALEFERSIRSVIRDRSAHVMVPESLYIKTKGILDNS